MSVTLFNTPTLETERLILRAPKAEDWPHWRAFMASDRSRFMRDEEIDDGKSWRAFGHVVGHWVLRGYGSFVYTLRDDDRALGMTGPWHPFDWPEREIGWSVWTPEAEGRGYAFEAAKAARAHAFEQLGWNTAVSYVAYENARSIALAERLGAVRDGSAKTPWDEPCFVFRHPTPQEVAA